MTNELTSIDTESGPPNKISKSDNSVDPAPDFLRRASLKEVLSNDSNHKSSSLLFEDSNGQQGVLMLIKPSFTENIDTLNKISKQSKFNVITKNDIFGSYEMLVPAELNGLQAQLIYPANEKIIAKYKYEEKFIINETYDDYLNITLPFIEEYQMNLQWVYNILNKSAEQDKMIFEDPDPHSGFILSNDIKWDGKNLETLYVLAIIHRKNVKSVRDLTAADLPLLENLKEKCLKIIHEKFGLQPNNIRAYFHYQPSFFHLHVHFVNLKYDAPASSTLSAILLDDVINNLRLMPDYYQKATLNFTGKKSDKLLQLFKNAGRCSM